MAEHIVLEIVQDARAQPQHSPLDPVTCEREEETPRALPQPPPNDPVTCGIEVEDEETPPNNCATEEEEETPQAQPQPPPNDPVTCEIEEEMPRAQPQQPPNDPVTCEIEEVETQRAQPQPPPNNDPVAGETKEDQRQQIDPKLLRAIVNGDLALFKSMTNVGNSGLGGVTCGENTAIHVVAGVLEKSSKISQIHMYVVCFLLMNKYYGFILGFYMLGLIFYYHIIKPTMLFFLPSNNTDPEDTLLKGTLAKKIWQVMKQLFLVKRRTLLEQHTKWKLQKEEIEKARRNLWSKLYFPPSSILYKRSMYLQIAEIIYRQDQDRTLLNARNYAMETPLHCAAKAGNLQMVSLLVNFAREEGPQKLEQLLWARNQVGETALHEAARSGYSYIVEELLGADDTLASLVDNNGISPLYLAVAFGWHDVVDMLIAPNLRPSYEGPDEQTVLHAAIMRQQGEILRVILEWNPSLAVITDKARNTPLHYAASIGNIYAVRKLLSKDTGSVYKANLSGSFPVHLAAEAGNFSVIKELLSMCPDVCELLDKQNRNFLHVAVQKRWKQIITFVCHSQEGINANMLNAKDNDGNTPLHLAVISSQPEIFVVLYKNKRVNPYIKNKEGLTPLDISASLQDHQFTYSITPQSIIHNALLKHGAFRNPCQPDASKIVNNLGKKDDGASVGCRNRIEGQEMSNGVGVDIEKESTKYENMSKSLVTGAVLIASATFVAIFTVSGVYKGDNISHTLMSRRKVFEAFVMADVLAFICAIVSTIWLLYSALSNFHLKYRKFYFQWCTPFLYGAINLFILTFGLGGYITIAPLSEWMALFILVICGIAILWNIIWSPKLIPIIHLAPFVLREELR